MATHPATADAPESSPVVYRHLLSMTAQNLIWSAFVLCLLVAYPYIARYQYQKGRAEGWLEHYAQQVAKEKARRDYLGRFRSKTKI